MINDRNGHIIHKSHQHYADDAPIKARSHYEVKETLTRIQLKMNIFVTESKEM